MEFRYLIDGKPASNWFKCSNYTLEDFEIEEIYLKYADITNWQLEYRG